MNRFVLVALLLPLLCLPTMAQYVLPYTFTLEDETILLCDDGTCLVAAPGTDMCEEYAGLFKGFDNDFEVLRQAVRDMQKNNSGYAFFFRCTTEGLHDSLMCIDTNMDLAQDVCAPATLVVKEKRELQIFSDVETAALGGPPFLFVSILRFV